MELNLTKHNFDSTISTTEIPVMVDFWANWCGPCKLLAPVIEELTSEMISKAIIGKVNVDEEPEIAERFGIQAIPTILIFKNGEVVEKIVGVRSKEGIVSTLEKHC